MSRVAAVVVTYGATLAQVRRLLGSIEPQVKHVILVDNGSPSLKNLKSNSRLHIIRLDQNYGLAYAQNVGIEKAIKLKADHVLFLDQDSVPHRDMVQELCRSIRNAQDRGIRVATAGPIRIDSHTGKKANFIKSFWRTPFIVYPDTESRPSYSLVDFVISSGSLVPIEVLRLVGGQRGDYFIDHVDTEWTIRAGAKGLETIGVHTALMEHRVGDSAHRFWLFGWKYIFWHQPWRNYYVYRNTFLMAHDNPFNIWQLHLVMRLIKLMIYFLIFSPDRFRRIRFMLMGIRDGLLNRRGMLDPKTLKLHPIPKTSMDPR